VCVELYRWSIELEGNINPTFSSSLGSTLLFIEKATIDPLYLWVIKLAGSSWFPKLDLRVGYDEIRVAPGEEHKAAFQTHIGHFEFLVLSFG
jgi:hypothetical protein